MAMIIVGSMNSNYEYPEILYLLVTGILMFALCLVSYAYLNKWWNNIFCQITFGFLSLATFIGTPIWGGFAVLGGYKLDDVLKMDFIVALTK